MRKLFCTIALFATLAATAAETAPDVLVRTTSTDVLAAISSQSLSPSDKRFQEMIETKALPNFDFGRITASAVGKNWRDATPDQQASLTREFKTLLVRTYSTALTSTKIRSIDVRPVSLDSKDTQVLVRTNVNPVSGQSFPIDYRMFKEGDNWKVIDVAVEGVSLVTNYRTTFNQTVQQSGVDGLIKTLINRNASSTVK